MEERFLIFKIDSVVSRSYANHLLIQLENNQLISEIAQKNYKNYAFVGISKDYETTMGKLVEILEHKEKPIIILDSFEFFLGNEIDITDPRESHNTVLYFKIYNIYSEKDKDLDNILYNLEAINLGLTKDMELYKNIYNNPKKDWTESILCNYHNS